MLRLKYPIEYELNPTEIEKGTNWVTLKLKNIGNETLRLVDIQLHSLYTYNLTVYGVGLFGGGHYLSELKAGEENELVFICGRYEGIDQRIIDMYVDAADRHGMTLVDSISGPPEIGLSYPEPL